MPAASAAACSRTRAAAAVVAAASSATPPAGTIAVTPADRIRVEASPSATSPNVYYLTISSAAGATLTTLPGVNLTLSAPAVGTYQEAQFSNGKWNNVVTSSSNGNTTGVGATSVSFAPDRQVDHDPGRRFDLSGVLSRFVPGADAARPNREHGSRGSEL